MGRGANTASSDANVLYGTALARAARQLAEEEAAEAPAAEWLRIPVKALQAGDILTPTNRTIQRLVFNGIKIPSGKVQVVFTNGHHANFGKNTTVTVLRPAA